MRLIDADKLVSHTYTIDRDHDYETYDIEHAPTVDAIPVEWIEKWLDEFLGVKLEEEITDLDPFKKNVYQGIFLMYNDWRRGDGK